jgi:hypothetical protein
LFAQARHGEGCGRGFSRDWRPTLLGFAALSANLRTANNA